MYWGVPSMHAWGGGGTRAGHDCSARTVRSWRKKKKEYGRSAHQYPCMHGATDWLDNPTTLMPINCDVYSCSHVPIHASATQPEGHRQRMTARARACVGRVWGVWGMCGVWGGGGGGGVWRRRWCGFVGSDGVGVVWVLVSLGGATLMAVVRCHGVGSKCRVWVLMSVGGTVPGLGLGSGLGLGIPSIHGEYQACIGEYQACMG